MHLSGPQSAMLVHAPVAVPLVDFPAAHALHAWAATSK